MKSRSFNLVTISVPEPFSVCAAEQIGITQMVFRVNPPNALVIDTPGGTKSRTDEGLIRREAWRHQIPCITTISGASVAVNGIESLKKSGLSVKALQSYHAESSRRIDPCR